MVPLNFPVSLLLIGVVGITALSLLAYWLQQARDMMTPSSGDYTVAWVLGCGALIVMGGAPGIVGLGLYLTVERDLAIDVLLVLTTAAVALFGIGSLLIV